MLFNNFISIPVHPNADPKQTVIVQINAAMIAMWNGGTMPSSIEGVTKPCVVVAMSGAGTLLVPMSEQEFQDELATAGLTYKPN